jgi:hypothetical protein
MEQFCIIHSLYNNVEGIRYKEFKLAILSIVWRMSVTSDSFLETAFVEMIADNCLWLVRVSQRDNHCSL